MTVLWGSTWFRTAPRSADGEFLNKHTRASGGLAEERREGLIPASPHRSVLDLCFSMSSMFTKHKDSSFESAARLLYHFYFHLSVCLITHSDNKHVVRFLGLYIRGVEENSRSRKEGLLEEDECIVRINNTDLMDKTFSQ